MLNLAPKYDCEALYEICLRGEYQAPAELAPRLERVEHIIDVGANVGIFSVYAAQHWPQADITALEPDPANAEAFRRSSVGMAETTNFIEAAASTHDGVLPFTASLGTGSHLAKAEEVDSIEVRCVDLYPHLARAQFAKIDIEGGEWPVLADARLSGLTDLILVMEYHRVGAPALPAREAAQHLLEDAGFTTGYGSSDYRGHGTIWAWKM